MKYIIFDMEWNQPASHSEKDPALPHGEIIQLGYFLLDERLEPILKNEITIRPVCYPQMNPFVSALTGITQEKARRGTSFPEALRKMAECFDEETVLFTWGDDDMPILRENIAFHGLTDITLPPHYNLQRFFCSQTNVPLRQIGLKTAAEQFGVEINVQSHDALNDAYITLLVAKKLDIPRGIAEYRRCTSAAKGNPQQPWLNEEPVSERVCDYSGSIDGMVKFCRGSELPCPVCGGKMSSETFCRQGKTGVITRSFCDTDGLFFVRFAADGGFMQTSVYRLNEPLEKLYRSKLRQKEKSDHYRRLHRDAARIKRKSGEA